MQNPFSIFLEFLTLVQGPVAYPYMNSHKSTDINIDIHDFTDIHLDILGFLWTSIIYALTCYGFSILGNWNVAADLLFKTMPQR